MKPTLTLLPGKPSAEDIAKLFERITGRKSSEREMEEVQAILANADPPPAPFAPFSKNIASRSCPKEGTPTVFLWLLAMSHR